jgi:Na+/H+ antiporter NhaD/arsenite permease-like protein
MASSQTAQLVAGVICLVTIAIIISDWIHRTIAAWAGAAAMIAAGLLMGFYSQHQALAAIDFNTLVLLLSMMLLIAMLAHTGVFEHLAAVAAKRARGSPWRLLILLGGLTAVISMFLNNVTVMVLIGPVTVAVSSRLGISPVPFLITEAVLSNVGGTATLIGDPPNTLIASAAGFSFNAFLVILLPIVVISYYPTLLALRHAFAHQLMAPPAEQPIINRLTPAAAITDPRALRTMLLVLGAVVIMFIFQDKVRLQIGYIAFAGAAGALVALRPDPEKLFQEVEWNTLLFFASLFVLIGGLEAAGILNAAAHLIVDATANHPLLTAVLLIWIAALLSAIVDNIPFVIAMIPILKQLESQGLAVEPLWWALALGAGFGGNGTPIGASANILALAISERAGYPITFRTWLRSATVATLVSCTVGSAVFLLIFGIIKR